MLEITKQVTLNDHPPNQPWSVASKMLHQSIEGDALMLSYIRDDGSVMVWKIRGGQAVVMWIQILEVGSKLWCQFGRGPEPVTDAVGLSRFLGRRGGPPPLGVLAVTIRLGLGLLLDPVDGLAQIGRAS